MHLVRIVGPPLGETALQLRPGGRRNEDAHRFRALGAHLLGPLNLNIQYHIPALIQGGIHIFFGCSVEIAHILGVLQKRLLLDHLMKILRSDEVIMYAVQLLFPGRPGGSGYGKIQIRVLPKQSVKHRALAHAGRAGNNKCLTLNQSNSSRVKSSTFIPKRGAIFSVERADSTTWSLSIISTAAVFRP